MEARAAPRDGPPLLVVLEPCASPGGCDPPSEAGWDADARRPPAPLPAGQQHAESVNAAPWNRALYELDHNLWFKQAAWLRKHGKAVPHRLSEDHVDQLKECFRLMDADNSGAIDVSELGAALQLLGLRLRPEQLVDLVHEVDVDRSGMLELAEFLDIMANVLKRLEEQPDMYEETTVPITLVATQYRRKRLLDGLLTNDTQLFTMIEAMAEARARKRAERCVRTSYIEAEDPASPAGGHVSGSGAASSTRGGRSRGRTAESARRRDVTQLPPPSSPGSPPCRLVAAAARLRSSACAAPAPHQGADPPLDASHPSPDRTVPTSVPTPKAGQHVSSAPPQQWPQALVTLLPGPHPLACAPQSGSDPRASPLLPTPKVEQDDASAPAQQWPQALAALLPGPHPLASAPQPGLDPPAMAPSPQRRWTTGFYGGDNKSSNGSDVHGDGNTGGRGKTDNGGGGMREHAAHASEAPEAATAAAASELFLPASLGSATASKCPTRRGFLWRPSSSCAGSASRMAAAAAAATMPESERPTSSLSCAYAGRLGSALRRHGATDQQSTMPTPTLPQQQQQLEELPALPPPLPQQQQRRARSSLSLQPCPELAARRRGAAAPPWPPPSPLPTPQSPSPWLSPPRVWEVVPHRACPLGVRGRSAAPLTPSPKAVVSPLTTHPQRPASRSIVAATGVRRAWGAAEARGTGLAASAAQRPDGMSPCSSPLPCAAWAYATPAAAVAAREGRPPRSSPLMSPHPAAVPGGCGTLLEP